MEATQKEAEWEGQWEGDGVVRDELVTGWRENEREESKEGGGNEGVHSWVIQHGRPA